LNGPSYASDEWKTFFKSRCTEECSKKGATCRTWKHMSASHNGTACVISIEMNCE
jgi:hypothetical protein